MANEIAVNVSVTVEKNNFKLNFTPGRIQLDMAGTGGGNPGIIALSTSEEDIAFGDVAPGYVIIRNLDASINVSYGPKSGGSMVLLGTITPGEVHLFQLGAAVTLRMVAASGTPKVQIIGIDA